MDRLPKILPGHWDTEEGREIALAYGDKERTTLTKGELSDLVIANRVFLADRSDLDLIIWQTAAKERIRWLSVQLALARHREDAVARGLADQVGEAMEDGGFWRSCSGCHETSDGYPTGPYTHSAGLKCDLGGGCHECGGIGAIWDNADYADMAAFMQKYDRDYESIKRTLIDGGVSPFLADQLTVDIVDLNEVTEAKPDHRRWVAVLLMGMILVAGVAIGWVLGGAG